MSFRLVDSAFKRSQDFKGTVFGAHPSTRVLHHVCSGFEITWLRYVVPQSIGFLSYIGDILVTGVGKKTS